MLVLWVSNAEPNDVQQAQIAALGRMLRADVKCLLTHDVCMDTYLSPPALAAALARYMSSERALVAVAPHTPHWIRVLSLLAAGLGVPFISGMKPSKFPACERAACANRLVECMNPPSSPFCATLQPEQPGNADGLWHVMDGQNLNLGACGEGASASFEAFTSGFNDLDGARIVFSGGRGLGGLARFERLAACAKKYGAALAASRMAVDMGWCRNDIQVGQTGHAIAPDIYVAFGISGAIQHLAGIQNAAKIIAVNTDKDAPIFQMADEGIVADAGEVIEALLKT